MCHCYTHRELWYWQVYVISLFLPTVRLLSISSRFFCFMPLLSFLSQVHRLPLISRQRATKGVSFSSMSLTRSNSFSQLSGLIITGFIKSTWWNTVLLRNLISSFFSPEIFFSFSWCFSSSSIKKVEVKKWNAKPGLGVGRWFFPRSSISHWTQCLCLRQRSFQETGLVLFPPIVFWTFGQFPDPLFGSLACRGDLLEFKEVQQSMNPYRPRAWSISRYLVFQSE